MTKRKDYVDEIIKNETGQLVLKNVEKYRNAYNTLFVEGSKVRVTLLDGIIQVKQIDAPEGVL